MLGRIDRAAYGAVDQAVLFLWNRTGVHRRQLMRGAAVAWMVLIATELLEGSVLDRVVTGGFLLLAMAIMASTEIRQARISDELHNVVAVMKRHHPAIAGLRWAWMLFMAPGMLAYWTVPDRLAGAAVLTYVWLTDALTPTEPPKRREREVDLVPEGAS